MQSDKQSISFSSSVSLCNIWVPGMSVCFRIITLFTMEFKTPAVSELFLPLTDWGTSPCFNGTTWVTYTASISNPTLLQTINLHALHRLGVKS